MWYFSTTTGELRHDADTVGPSGYSGHYNGRNNPELEHLPNIGPIPRGLWHVVGPPIDTPAHGPFVLGLWPDPATDHFSRTGFLIHGDSVKKPGSASMGCIILARASREAIWQSADHQLTVT